MPYVLQKRNSNSPFMLKGQNFSTEDILPPGFGLEDVFLRNELKSNNHQGSILIKNDASSTENLQKVGQYVRYFHTSDGARNRQSNYYNSSSLDPYHDSPPYVQHSESSDFLGTCKPFKPNGRNIQNGRQGDRSTINSESGSRLTHDDGVEDSPFFIKRRIRSSNPHARVKRKPHPMISRQFFKKQMSRRGTRCKMNGMCWILNMFMISDICFLFGQVLIILSQMT